MASKRVSIKHRVLYSIAAILFLGGLLTVLYPQIADLLYRSEVDTLKQEFERQAIAGETAESGQGPSVLRIEELYQELTRRNETLFREKQKNLKDPFSYEQPGIDLSSYGLQGNIIGFLSIPKMDVELPILLGANEANMNQGAVHLTETSYPVGGQNTNCVLAAHRRLSRTAMFRDIEKLEVGDKIYIENFRETLTYRVTELRVILPTDIQDLLIQEGRDMVTLFTCHPYGYSSLRYVVFCEREPAS